VVEASPDRRSRLGGGRLWVWLLSRNSWSLLPASLAITAGIAVAATGLSGQDVDLDRTAALPWPVRRLAHLVLIGAVTGALVLVCSSWVTRRSMRGW